MDSPSKGHVYMSLPIQEYINNGSVEHLRDAITGELTRCMMCAERISSVREQQISFECQIKISLYFYYLETS